MRAISRARHRGAARVARAVRRRGDILSKNLQPAISGDFGHIRYAARALFVPNPNSDGVDVAYFGWPSLCLRVRDLEISKAFYSRMGMEVVSEVEGKTVVLSYGTFRLALMTFLDGNLINFRSGDIRQIFEELGESFPNVEGEPEDYTAEQYEAAGDGVCWATRDPDGNEIFFDTNETEIGPEYVRKRSLEVLRGAAKELNQLGADPKLLATLEDLVISPYANNA